MKPSHLSARVSLVASCIGLFVVGCDAPIDSFQPNSIFARRMELNESIEMAEPLSDTDRLLREWFGTPDQPRWPEFLTENQSNETRTGEQALSLVSLDRLQLAAGAVSSDETGSHTGLYREHCVVCHGITGNGLGPSAALLSPYPRDFRMGKVKFKSTPIGEKPTREDLRKTLQRGIVGTSMPAFGLLAEEELESLVDYLIYLSFRGELERKLLLEAAVELDLEDGQRVYDSSLKERDAEKFAERMGSLKSVAIALQNEWLEAEEKQLQVEGPPDGFPIVGRSPDTQSLEQSIANGKKLFQGNVASCSFCHGANAQGDGQPNNYDEWTRDWTVMAGLSPKNEDELEPMLELGALKPRNILPRNLTLGAFRGGDSPEELYTRIVLGIEGTPMPAAPLKPANPQGLEEREVWDLVNYLLSLQATYSSSSNTSASNNTTTENSSPTAITQNDLPNDGLTSKTPTDRDTLVIEGESS